MKHKILKTVYLLILASICQSCSFHNSKNLPIYGCEDIRYLYTNYLDTASIILLPSGYFIYSRNNNDYILGELRKKNKGIWLQKKDTIILTTFFQNKFEDFFMELGDIEYKDSILIHIYSLQTEKPTDDFAFFNENDSLILPTIEGHLCVACTEKENLIKQLFLEMIDNNEMMSVSLECGKEYKYYIKDCIPLVMHEEKFIVTDSCLFQISLERLYRLDGRRKRETTKVGQQPNTGSNGMFNGK